MCVLPQLVRHSAPAARHCSLPPLPSHVQHECWLYRYTPFDSAAREYQQRYFGSGLRLAIAFPCEHSVAPTYKHFGHYDPTQTFVGDRATVDMGQGAALVHVLVGGFADRPMQVWHVCNPEGTAGSPSLTFNLSANPPLLRVDVGDPTLCELLAAKAAVMPKREEAAEPTQTDESEEPGATSAPMGHRRLEQGDRSSCDIGGCVFVINGEK